MNAAIISIGDELLIGRTLNTNMNYIAKELSKCGVKVAKELTVRDERSDITSAINYLRNETDIIITIGGLGVTGDDITKKVVADYVKKKLVYDAESLLRIEKYCSINNRPFTDIMKLFARIPDGSVPIPNKVGIATGCMLSLNGFDMIMLPGPPAELISMMQNTVIPYFKSKLTDKQQIVVVKIFGLKEVDVFLGLKELIEQYRNDAVITTYCALLEVSIILRYNEKTGKKIADKILFEIYEKFKNNIYADSDISLEKQLITKFSVQGKTLAVAESVSGGCIANALISIPGASKVFVEGLVTYSNESKISRLNVKPETLANYGAVSEQVAYEMAEGLINSAKCDFAIATTGIAGPDGGTMSKPVGLCYIAIGTRDKIVVFKHIFLCNDREEVRELVKKTALFYCLKKIK